MPSQDTQQLIAALFQTAQTLNQMTSERNRLELARQQFQTEVADRDRVFKLREEGLALEKESLRQQTEVAMLKAQKDSLNDELRDIRTTQLIHSGGLSIDKTRLEQTQEAVSSELYGTPFAAVMSELSAARSEVSRALGDDPTAIIPEQRSVLREKLQREIVSPVEAKIERITRETRRRLSASGRDAISGTSAVFDDGQIDTPTVFDVSSIPNLVKEGKPESLEVAVNLAYSAVKDLPRDQQMRELIAWLGRKGLTQQMTSEEIEELSLAVFEKLNAGRE